jgi:hypothetical protein
VTLRPAVFEHNVLVLGIARFFQALAERDRDVRVWTG